jgi:molecular chaperone GrpE (heat shock protein)
MNKTLLLVQIAVLLCLLPAGVASQQSNQGSTGSTVSDTTGKFEATTADTTKASEPAASTAPQRVRRQKPILPASTGPWYSRMLNSSIFFPAALGVLLIALLTSVAVWQKNRIAEWIRLFRSDYKEERKRPHRTEINELHDRSERSPVASKEKPAHTVEDLKEPIESKVEEEEFNNHIGQFEDSFHRKMGEVQNNIDELRRDLRINRERVEKLATEHAGVVDRLQPKSFMDSVRSVYEDDCRARLAAMFEKGDFGSAVADRDQEDIEHKRLNFERILFLLNEINSKLRASSQIDRGRAQSDLQDLDRQILAYKERTASQRTVTTELTCPPELNNPHFADFKEYAALSNSSPAAGAAGYLAFLSEEYKRYVDKAGEEIRRQIGLVQSASETSDRSIQEFVRRDLMNIIDTVDAIVKKSTGTHRSHVVDDEIRDICEMLGVSEIDATVGEPYAAHFHQPIKRERGGFSKDSITEVHARGFINDDGQIIRKARVTIAE